MRGLAAQQNRETLGGRGGVLGEPTGMRMTSKSVATWIAAMLLGGCAQEDGGSTIPIVEQPLELDFTVVPDSVTVVAGDTVALALVMSGRDAGVYWVGPFGSAPAGRASSPLELLGLDSLFSRGGQLADTFFITSSPAAPADTITLTVGGFIGTVGPGDSRAADFFVRLQSAGVPR